jgi:hypothetical protein
MMMPPDINYPGICACGCGGKTSIAAKTNTRDKTIKGKPRRFIPGHHIRKERNPKWRGGSWINKQGYVLLFMPEHPRSDKSGQLRQHVLVCEKAFGRPLPDGAVIHHVDENGSNNQNSNLVICQDNTYHTLIHLRLRAVRACGHADWRRCRICKKYDQTANLRTWSVYGRILYCHAECDREEQRNRRIKTLKVGSGAS